MLNCTLILLPYPIYQGLAASAAYLLSSGVTNSLSDLQHCLEGSSGWIFLELQLHDLLQAEATRLVQVIHLRRQFNLSSSDLLNGAATPPPTAVSSGSTGEDSAGPSASGDVAGSGADSAIVLDESEEMSPPDNRLYLSTFTVLLLTFLYFLLCQPVSLNGLFIPSFCHPFL